MKRRDFINTGILSTVAGTLFNQDLLANNSTSDKLKFSGKVKNIIFLVSDGMSNGTLNMADLLLQRKEGRGSHWVNLYRENKVRRALMDTSSADSMVTDSAAASSAWGGGVKVNNGKLNVGADGSCYKPILQKFKESGKSVGCVTTVPITHATPAGFCINAGNRGNQDIIASMYLPLKFDVMMGGGLEFFTAEKRKDKKELLSDYRAQGYQVVSTKEEMKKATAEKPLLGVFYNDGLPFTLDQNRDNNLIEIVPSLAAMTEKAISLLSDNPNGFMLQIEGGKVDWAAHSNDIGALLYDQIAFDDAIEVAIKFAEKNNDTWVIITTDHGNSNPGLIKSKNADRKFETIQTFKHTNEWILNGIKKYHTPAQIIERINYAQGIVIKEEEARQILNDYSTFSDEDLYNPYKLPYRKMALIQQNYTSVGWSGMDHSADFVELAIFGPDNNLLKPFLKNTELHNLMLKAAGIL